MSTSQLICYLLLSLGLWIKEIEYELHILLYHTIWAWLIKYDTQHMQT